MCFAWGKTWGTAPFSWAIQLEGGWQCGKEEKNSHQDLSLSESIITHCSSLSRPGQTDQKNESACV
jgi:hypothetical protein